MAVTHTKHFTLGANDVDFLGRWRPSAILGAMQDGATDHAETLGFGRDTLLAREQIWILSRTHLQMLTYPMMDEPVVLRTWPGVTNRFFFPRHYLFERPDGTRLGAASSLWLVLDLQARAVIPPAKFTFEMPDTADIPAPLPTPARVAHLESPARTTERTPVYTDLDVNGHVNNTRYADWVCNDLPLDWHRDHCIENLLLNYTKEILPGQTIRCALAMEDDRFTVIGQAPDDGPVFFEAGGSWMPWHTTRRV